MVEQLVKKYVWKMS